jgi:signal transduction histidine kinase
MIHKSDQHLLTLVNSILDMARIEAGRMPMEMVEVDLARMLRDTVELFRPKAEGKGLQLDFATSRRRTARIRLGWIRPN